MSTYQCQHPDCVGARPISDASAAVRHSFTPGHEALFVADPTNPLYEDDGDPDSRYAIGQRSGRALADPDHVDSGWS